MKTRIKIGSIVRVVKSDPAPHQEPIEHLVGKTYKVNSYDDDDKTVSVYDDNYGTIVLQRSEFEPTN